MTLRLVALCSLLPTLPLCAVESGASPSAAEIAAHLRSSEEGNSYVRLRLETSGAKTGVVQIQIKARRAPGNSTLLYQALWPKERKGEAVLLRKNGGALSGTIYDPAGNSAKPLAAAQLSEPFFGSALSYEDLVDDFLSWPQQAIVGSETVDRAPCQILESKPGKGEHSYSSVRTWVDTRRMVALKVEKYGGPGKLVRKIETTRVANDDLGHPIPANLSITGPGGVDSQLDGSKIKHGLEFPDSDFSPEGMRQTAIPHGSPE